MITSSLALGNGRIRRGRRKKRLPHPGAFQTVVVVNGYPPSDPDETGMQLELAYDLAREVIEQARIAE